MPHLLHIGDRVAWEALPGAWLAGVVAALRGEMAAVERLGGVEVWLVRADALRRVRR